MRVKISELSIELIAENVHEHNALARLLEHHNIEVKPGESSDRSWPPDLKKVSAILVLPDPSKW